MIILSKAAVLNKQYSSAKYIIVFHYIITFLIRFYRHIFFFLNMVFYLLTITIKKGTLSFVKQKFVIRERGAGNNEPSFEILQIFFVEVSNTMQFVLAVSFSSLLIIWSNYRNIVYYTSFNKSKAICQNFDLNATKCSNVHHGLLLGG